MRLRGRQKEEAASVTPLQHTEPRGLVAAAARINNRLDGQGWRTWRFGDDSWQQEAWRLYDVVGELRFVANWIGSACSRVRLYVADVDENGRVQQETKNKRVAGLADTLFGGPAAKAEAMRMLGINLTVAGDAYIVGRDRGADPDEWMVVSNSELRRQPNGGKLEWIFGEGRKGKQELDLDKSLIIRVWTPHPRRNLWADSPTRGALPMLWEIERLTRYVFAQIDSRLVSAGLLFVPKEVSFSDENPTETGAEGLTARLMRAGTASLKGEGSAAGVVPTIAELPEGALGKVQLVQFSSELSQQALELRAEALRRFALAMDIDPSILAGAGDANHWGAWQILEGQVNVHIVPLVTRMCDALTTAYLRPALKDMGSKVDPDRFAYWFDTAPLTVRPERLKETRELQEKGLVSRATVLKAGDYAITDAPALEEELMLFTRELMLRDSNLFQNPAVRKVAGYTEEILPADTVIAPPPGSGGMGGAGPPPPPPPPTGISPTAGGPMPVDSVAQNALPGPGGESGRPAGTPAGVTASAGVDPVAMADLNTFLVANATVLRALERAGKRLLTRGTARQLLDVPAHELHTQLPGRADMAAARDLLTGAWDQMAVLGEAAGQDAELTQRLQPTLESYCLTLLVQQEAHRPELLARYLRARGHLHD